MARNEAGVRSKNGQAVSSRAPGASSPLSAASRTIHKEITVLKHALSLAVEWELLNSNPAQDAKLPKVPEGRTRYLSPTELKAALDAAEDWMRAPIALAAFTGMRRGELLGLRWMDVDLDGSQLRKLQTSCEGLMRLNWFGIQGCPRCWRRALNC